MNLPLPAQITYDDGQRRLVLRPAMATDAEALVEAIHESLPELRGFMPWAHLPQTVNVQRLRLQALEEGYAAGGDYIFHAFETVGTNNSERFVGCFGLHDRTLNKDGAELGYWVRSTAAGRGIATLASKMIALACFEHMSCVRLQCAYNEANVGSRVVQQRVGFLEEGRLLLFEMQGDDVMREDGYQVSPYTVINALTVADMPKLPWPQAVRPHLDVQLAVG